MHRWQGAAVCHVAILLLLLPTHALADLSFEGATVTGLLNWSNSGIGNLFYPFDADNKNWVSGGTSNFVTNPNNNPAIFFATDNNNAANFVRVQFYVDGTIVVYVNGLDALLGTAAEATLTLTSTSGPNFLGLGLSLKQACGDITSYGVLGDGTIKFTLPKAASCGSAPRRARAGPALIVKLGSSICFPASSTMRRLSRPAAADAPEEAWETVAMPDLRVGDTVECLARDPVFGRNIAMSAAYGRLGHCKVYGYKKALPAAATTQAPYVRITYEPLADADAPSGAVTMSANHHLLDPLTSQARQAGSLRPGEAVLRATPSGALVPARVLSVASVREGGAYVPLLSGGGLPIVDGVVAYPSSGQSDVGLDAKHWGQHYLHAPLWQPLLPAAATPAGRTEREASPPGAGRTLAELGAQAPVAAFTKKWHSVRAAAAREGRATCDWAGVATEMHAAITGEGKRYSEAEALAVLDRHHKAVPPTRGVAEA